MNNKIEMLAKEYNKTMEHAKEVFNEYVDAVIEQFALEAFNELSNNEKMVLLYCLGKIY